MMEMIERVARAMVAPHAPPNMQYEKWVEALHHARLAIEAMREPTEAMITARFNVLGQGGKAEWEAMIDAALKEPV